MVSFGGESLARFTRRLGFQSKWRETPGRLSCAKALGATLANINSIGLLFFLIRLIKQTGLRVFPDLSGLETVNILHTV